jgi:hypothetical protein
MIAASGTIWLKLSRERHYWACCFATKLADVRRGRELDSYDDVGVFLLPSFDSVPLISLVMFSRCRQINRTHITNTAGKYAVKPNKYAV